MHFPCTITMEADHPRVPDVLFLTDCNALPFRKIPPRNTLCLNGYGTQRIPFRSPSADLKSPPQSSHIHSPDKTVHTRITVVPLPHLQPTPPHPVCFCNIAYTHLISVYGNNHLLSLDLYLNHQHMN